MIIFTIPITTVPASRPRVTRWATYYGKKYTQYKKDIKEWLLDCDQKPKTPICGLFYVKLIHYIPIAKSTSKKRKLEMNGKYCDKNIDLDNMNKAVEDNVLNNIFIEDDRYIVKKFSEKYWTDKLKGWTEVTIEKI